MSALAFVFSSGWASGLNCYLGVLVLGVSDRVHDTEQVPNVLQRWDVLGVAALFYAMEFVADKIPYVASTWDAASTAIRPTRGRAGSPAVRPTAGAGVGVLLAGQADSLNGAVAAVVGGGSALLSHAVKSG